MNSKLFELSVEVKAVSEMLNNLNLALDSNAGNITPESLQNTLFGMSKHLNRISEDMEKVK